MAESSSNSNNEPTNVAPQSADTIAVQQDHHRGRGRPPKYMTEEERTNARYLRDQKRLHSKYEAFSPQQLELVKLRAVLSNYRKALAKRLQDNTTRHRPNTLTPEQLRLRIDDVEQQIRIIQESRATANNLNN